MAVINLGEMYGQLRFTLLEGDLSHATRANRYEDLVSAEFCDCRERHMSDAALGKAMRTRT
jgi:hypothetical protein